MRRAWLSLGIVALIGCPEPVDEVPALGDPGTNAGGPGEMSSPPLDGPPAGNTANGGGAPAANNGGALPSTEAPTAIGAPPVGGLDASAAPPNLGTFAGDLSDAELKPAYSQADLADGAVIKGTLSCDTCTGQLLVRVLPPPPDNPAAAAGDSLQLVTQAPFTAAGPFEIKVPSGEPVVLQVVDDANMDGFPSQGERMGMRADGPVISEGVLEGVELTVGVFPAMADVGPGTAPTPGDVPTPGEVPTPGDAPAGEVPNPGDMPTPEGPPPSEGGPNPGDMPTPEGAPPANASGGPPGDDGAQPGDAGGPPADDG